MNADAPDQKLTKRLIDGEDLAWRELYDKTRGRLFGLIFYHIGNREDAMDVLQETYVSAVRGIHSFRGEGSIEAWLCGIAIRRSRDWKRRFLRRMKQTFSLDDVAEIPVDHSFGDPLEAALLHRSLKKISDRQRSVILLREWMGYSFREIAESLGISEPTARVHHHRGKEALRTLLQDAADLNSATPMQEQRS